MSQDITVRTNLYLWMLTGRSDDFANSALNTDIRYSIKSTPADVEHVRSLLKLGDTRTDFHVLACLAAARMSTSLLRDMPQDVDGVFANGHLNFPAFTTLGVNEVFPPDIAPEAVPNLRGLNALSGPAIDGSVAGAGDFTRVSFQESSGEVIITTDAGTNERAPYTVQQVASGPDEFLVTIPKAADYGVGCAFRVASWSLGDSITVNLAPTRYPFAAVAKAIINDTTTTRMMNYEGTLQAFSESSNPAKKVGLAALAVIRRMIRVINEDQSGYSVTGFYDDDGAEPLERLYDIEPVFVDGLDDPVVDDEAPVGFDA